MKKLYGFFLFTTVCLCLFLCPRALAEDSAYVNANHVRVRSTPEITSDNILGKLHYGDSVEILERYSEDWYAISYKGQTAYIYAIYVTEAEEESIQDLALCTTTATVHLRTVPSTSFRSLGKISSGAVLIAFEKTGKWAKVIYNQKEGYVCTDYLHRISTEGEVPLGSFTTSYLGSAKGRCHNIAYGGSKLNGTVVKPGYIFSLLEVLGPITQAGGYQEAPEFKQTKNGTETVKGYGGGVCQIATTLYQSVLASNAHSQLTITERHTHSKEVGYIAKGKDATVSWNSKLDFQFTNDNQYSIKIYVFTSNSTLTIAIVRC